MNDFNGDSSWLITDQLDVIPSPNMKHRPETMVDARGLGPSRWGVEYQGDGIQKVAKGGKKPRLSWEFLYLVSKPRDQLFRLTFDAQQGKNTGCLSKTVAMR